MSREYDFMIVLNSCKFAHQWNLMKILIVLLSGVRVEKCARFMFNSEQKYWTELMLERVYVKTTLKKLTEPSHSDMKYRMLN